jgi:hypothetical protein
MACPTSNLGHQILVLLYADLLIEFVIATPNTKQMVILPGFQIKPAAGGISVYLGHLRRLLSFGFQLKKKK